MQKQTKLYHEVTEQGSLQVRIVTEYIKDGNIEASKNGDPNTPLDTKDMTGWDDRSQDIVAAVTDEVVIDEFKIEQNGIGTNIVGVGLEEAIAYDRVVDEDGKIAVRRITRIFDDGVEVSKKYHRSWIMPGDDPKGADVMSRALAVKLHTPEVVAEYKTFVEDNKVESG